MKNSMIHFSKYAISKNRTLNVIGGYDGGGGPSMTCTTCGSAMITCPYGCTILACPSDMQNRIGYKCSGKNSVG